MNLATLNSELVTLRTSLRRYTQVILALLRREEERRRKSPGEAIAAILEPIIIIGVLTFMFWFLDRRSSPVGGSLFLFLVTGMFPKYYFMYLSRRMKRSVGKAGRGHYPVETRLDHITVYSILRTIDYAILGVVMFAGIAIFVTPDGIPWNIVPVAEGLLAIAMLGFFWGIVNMILNDILWFWHYLNAAIYRILLLISGVFFLVDLLPPNVRYILSFNPLLHAIILFRKGFYPTYPELVLDTSYLTYCAIFAVVFGLVIERVTRRYGE